MFGGLQGERQLLGPDAGAEAVDGVVGEGERLLGGAEGQGDQHGPEDLVHYHPGAGLHVRDEGGRVETAGRRRYLEHLQVAEEGKVATHCQY